MKKIISLIICILMLTTVLTGCGTNELSYLNTISEIMSIKTFSFSGEYEVSNPENIKLKLDGVADITNLSNAYLETNINFEYPTENIYIQDGKVIFKDNTIYLNKSLVRQFISTEESEGYMNTFDTAMADVEYISISSEELYLDDILLEKEINPATEILNMFKEIFNGFDTGLISKTNSGYVVELTDKNLVDTIDKFIDFIDKNKESIYDATFKVIDKYYDTFKTPEFPSKEEFVSEITNSYNKEKIMTVISETAKRYKEFAREEILTEIQEYKDSFYKQVLFRNNSKYSIKEDVVFNYPTYIALDDPTLDGLAKATSTIKFSGTTNIEPVKEIVKKDIPAEKCLDITLAQEKVDTEYNKIYPIVSVEITWVEPEYGANLFTINSEHENTYDYADLYMKDDRIYLPLRKIAELLGEIVEWDTENSKAYVVRDNEKIDMTGIIIDDRTMIKVRDFEKLGYKIDYEFNGYQNIATINK